MLSHIRDENHYLSVGLSWIIVAWNISNNSCFLSSPNNSSIVCVCVCVCKKNSTFGPKCHSSSQWETWFAFPQDISAAPVPLLSSSLRSLTPKRTLVLVFITDDAIPSLVDQAYQSGSDIAHVREDRVTKTSFRAPGGRYWSTGADKQWFEWPPPLFIDRHKEPGQSVLIITDAW